MTKQVLLYKLPEETIKEKRVSVLDDSALYYYNESINDFYNNKKARETLSGFNKHEGEATGSSSFMQVFLANSRLLPDGTRLSTRQDLEEAISSDKDFLSENYTCFGLALMALSIAWDYYGNNLLAEILSKQLKRRGIKLGEGKLIPLTALKLRQDNGSPYGLVFDLNEQATKETIRDLAEFKWDYTKEGLTCANLFKGKYWTYDDTRLGHSRDDGRVVVVHEYEIPLQKFLEESQIETIVKQQTPSHS